MANRDRTEAVYAAIRDFIDANGFPPTYRDIVEATDITSTSIVAHYLRRLEALGRIELQTVGGKTRRARAIRIVRDP